MGGPQIDQNRGGSLFWSIFFSFEGPRQNSDRGSSKHSGSLLWSIWICRGASPPLLIPILVNLVPPPHHWALFWSMYYLPPPLIPVMVNLSSISGCGVIIQHYSPHVALLWSIYHHLGALTTIFDQHCPHSRKLFYHNTKYTHYRFLHIWPWRNWLPSLS